MIAELRRALTAIPQNNAHDFSLYPKWANVIWVYRKMESVHNERPPTYLLTQIVPSCMARASALKILADHERLLSEKIFNTLTSVANFFTFLVKSQASYLNSVI